MQQDLPIQKIFYLDNISIILLMKSQQQQQKKINLILNTSIISSPKRKTYKRAQSNSPSYSYCLSHNNQQNKQQKQYHYFETQNKPSITEFKMIEDKIQKHKSNQNNIFFLQRKKNFMTKHQKITIDSSRKIQISQSNQSFAKMMDNIVSKQKKKRIQKQLQMKKQSNTINHHSIPFNASINLKNTLDLFEDRVQLYRLLKSRNNPIMTINSEATHQAYEPLSKKRAFTSCSQRKRMLIQDRNNFNTKFMQNNRVKVLEEQIQAKKKRPSTTEQIKQRIHQSLPIKKSKKFLPIKTIDEGDYTYTKKLRSFLQFIFKVNFSNKIYVPLDLMSSNYSRKDQSTKQIKKYKVFIGAGNNSQLIKSILGNRFWLQIVDDINDPDLNFSWTQNRKDDLHQRQPNSRTNDKFVLMGAGKQRQIKKYDKNISPEAYEKNIKILSGEDIWNIEKYINAGGFKIPFEQYNSKLITNHLPYNSFISTKKKLHNGLFHYYNFHKKNPFTHIPRTLTVNGKKDPEFNYFLEYIISNKLENSIWIVKPGQYTNRGKKIKLSKAKNIEKIIEENVKHEDGSPMSYIIQSYIIKPFLYNNRKFDIRHYMLVTSVKGNIKAYWYNQGYFRTSSEIFDLEDLQNQYIHLTNDAIQKQHQLYGVYEAGNKLSYSDFQRYLEYSHCKSKYSISSLQSQMKSIMKDVVRANYKAIDANRKQCNFELFGMDFMVDNQFKPWLIEINANPCLQMSCPLLCRIIPGLIQNTFRLGLDPLHPPMNHYPMSKRYNLTDKHLKHLKYQIIFDELIWSDSIPIKNMSLGSKNQQQQFQDNGKPFIFDSQNYFSFF